MHETLDATIRFRYWLIEPLWVGVFMIAYLSTSDCGCLDIEGKEIEQQSYACHDFLIYEYYKLPPTTRIC